ncbi:Clp protease N-terminal domain-containing protein [Amycolatopsis nigrescens]|uniref:Clp protease N-terminal domain-containing protein n=1 Tax=Amycolatopsis nigrescens TaxID=381445 RepID=UPI00035C328D|nr:Clp protease N-terminal domain-containing protein [Amycolatopsis nigrescens]
MFERFTRELREVVMDGQRQAVAERAERIEPGHLLLATLDHASAPGGALLRSMGVTREDVATELDRVRRRGGITDSDAAALGRLGIDVEQIVDHVEREHGENALAGSAWPRQRRSWRRHLAFADEAKRTLEHTLKAAMEVGDRDLGTEHLVLALVCWPGQAADVLYTLGVDQNLVRRALSRRKAS